MNILYVVSILILAAGAIFGVKYFMSDTNPDDDIKNNNSNRMMSRYKNK